MSKSIGVDTDCRYSAFEERWSHDREEDVVYALTKDCHSIYVYWSISRDFICQVEMHSRLTWKGVQPALCVYDVTDVQFDGYNAHSAVVTPVSVTTDNWYIHHLRGGRDYVVDFGVMPEGRFTPLLRSNCIRTPRPLSESVPTAVLAAFAPPSHSSWITSFTGYSIVENEKQPVKESHDIRVPAEAIRLI